MSLSNDKKKEYKYCEYCIDGNYIIDIDSVFAFIDEDDRLSVTVYNSYLCESFVKHIDINFCPMCGQRVGKNFLNFLRSDYGTKRNNSNDE